jgi:hypothetical protein
VQNHADGRHEHGHDEKLLCLDDENDERLQHADDDELQRHANNVLHLLIPANSTKKPPRPYGRGGFFISQAPHFPVGARLAREGGVSASINVGCAGPFAGKPRSYRDSGDPVGAGLLAKAEY